MWPDNLIPTIYPNNCMPIEQVDFRQLNCDHHNYSMMKFNKYQFNTDTMNIAISPVLIDDIANERCQHQLELT